MVYLFRLTDNVDIFEHFAADSLERIEEFAQQMGYRACLIQKFTGELSNYPYIHKI